VNPLSLSWRYFGTREVQLARDWVEEGGIAVHENLYRSRGRRAAHLIAPDEALLLAAARLLCCEAYWIQRTRTVHFDLVGVFLERALVICGVDPALPPARSTATGATPARI
jgi:hypothetical protein